MDFRVGVVDFLRFCAIERRLSEHTLRAYANDLADFRRWLPATTPAADICETTLGAYLADLVERRNLAAATVRRRFACLRSFFRYTSERELSPDPFAKLRLQLPRRKRLPRALSRIEASSLVTLGRRVGQPSASSTMPTAISLMVATGIRVSELCKLRIDDISPDGASCRIHGKGSRDRVVYVTDPALRRDLTDFVRLRRSSPESPGILFVNRNGMPIRPQSIRTSLRRLAKGVGLTRRVTPHMLRHTAATLLIETGVDIRFVQRLLGHASIATTEIYTHVSDEALRKTLERANILASLCLTHEAEKDLG